jgi:hypothetical protein
MQNSLQLSKIGVALNPERRRRSLETSSGLSIDLVKCWQVLDGTALQAEQYLHRTFARRRKAGEWFDNISISDVEYAGYELKQCNTDGTTRRER